MFTTKSLLIVIIRNVVFSLVIISATFFAAIFLSNKIEGTAAVVAQNKSLETELTQRTALSQALKHDTQIIGSNDVLIEAAFVPSDNISIFTTALDNLASQNSLAETYRFETPMPSTITAPFPIATILYQNSFGANVQTLLNYLTGLEKLPYFTKVEGFNISSQDKQGWLGQSMVSLRATLYTKNNQ